MYYSKSQLVDAMVKRHKMSKDEAKFRIQVVTQIFRESESLDLNDMYDILCDWLGEEFQDYFNLFI